MEQSIQREQSKTPQRPARRCPDCGVELNERTCRPYVPGRDHLPIVAVAWWPGWFIRTENGVKPVPGPFEDQETAEISQGCLGWGVFVGTLVAFVGSGSLQMLWSSRDPGVSFMFGYALLGALLGGLCGMVVADRRIHMQERVLRYRKKGVTYQCQLRPYWWTVLQGEAWPPAKWDLEAQVKGFIRLGEEKVRRDEEWRLKAEAEARRWDNVVLPDDMPLPRERAPWQPPPYAPRIEWTPQGYTWKP